MVISIGDLLGNKMSLEQSIDPQVMRLAMESQAKQQVVPPSPMPVAPANAPISQPTSSPASLADTLKALATIATPVMAATTSGFGPGLQQFQEKQQKDLSDMFVKGYAPATETDPEAFKSPIAISGQQYWKKLPEKLSEKDLMTLSLSSQTLAENIRKNKEAEKIAREKIASAGKSKGKADITFTTKEQNDIGLFSRLSPSIDKFIKLTNELPKIKAGTPAIMAKGLRMIQSQTGENPKSITAEREAGMLKSNIARIAGQTGVLTDKDIALTSGLIDQIVYGNENESKFAQERLKQIFADAKEGIIQGAKDRKRLMEEMTGQVKQSIEESPKQVTLSDGTTIPITGE